MAQYYAAKRPARGNAFYWASAIFGLFTKYRYSLTITLSDAGIHLETMRFFKIGHKPLLIPWDAVQAIKIRKIWKFKSAQLTIKIPSSSRPIKITFYGDKLLEELQQQLNKTHTSYRPVVTKV